MNLHPTPSGEEIMAMGDAFSELCAGKPAGTVVSAHLACLAGIAAAMPELHVFILDQLRAAIAMIEHLPPREPATAPDEPPAGPVAPLH